jgi:hypothetical protein
VIHKSKRSFFNLGILIANQNHSDDQLPQHWIETDSMNGELEQNPCHPKLQKKLFTGYTNAYVQNE